MRGDSRRIPRRALDDLVIVVGNAHENGEVGSFFEIQDDAGAFDGFPGGFEKKALLGVDMRSFAGGNSEELRVKLVDPVDKTAALRDRFSDDSGFGIVESSHVP